MNSVSGGKGVQTSPRACLIKWFTLRNKGRKAVTGAVLFEKVKENVASI